MGTVVVATGAEAVEAVVAVEAVELPGAVDVSVRAGSPAESAAEPVAVGGCGCGHQDRSGDLPELDARTVPHALRHGAIFGALDSLGLGSGMVLVAPHDPLPLLAQLETRSPGGFSTDYLERGPEAWRVRFIRA
jgi:uncharacterized protein (DUF2249 family)